LTLLAVATLAISTLALAGSHARAEAAAREIIDPGKVCPEAVDPTLKINAKEVCTLLVVVRNTLEQLKDRIPQTPRLTSITLNLKAETKREAGGEINIFVIKIGAKHSAETVQTLAVKFPLPKPGTEAVAPQVPFSTSLANSIVASFEAIKTSNINLTPGDLTMSVSFGVQNGVSGGGTIQIAPISISASGGIDTGSTQELSFKFGEKEE
jgi:hypothetical protein